MTSNVFFVNENIEILLFAQDYIDMTVKRLQYSQDIRLIRCRANRSPSRNKT
jgi:hypothetical protein